MMPYRIYWVVMDGPGMWNYRLGFLRHGYKDQLSSQYAGSSSNRVKDTNFTVTFNSNGPIHIIFHDLVTI